MEAGLFWGPPGTVIPERVIWGDAAHSPDAGAGT